ncbi:hypothetical protein BGZ95_004206 [Linnemannia exigua]|uniref:Uncharacterized protein n=1 Tax=Linnemannia exigua TaxID=604196 RepID=A0AAD4H0X7_9FUNG|nr:hypothetical protein BGZ95_004206 [Linnemannia exigua]
MADKPIPTDPASLVPPPIPPPPPPPPSGQTPSVPLFTPPPIPTYITIPVPDKPVYSTRPIPTNIGGGEGDPEPAKPTSTQPGSDPAVTDGRNPQPTTTKQAGGQQQQPSAPPANGNGEITFQPGVPTSFRALPSGSPSAAEAPSISGSVISGPMTGVVFAFAFLGALIIGLVTGFLIAKYTRLGGRRRSKEQKDQLTEQLRLLTESIGQRNEYQQHQLQHPHEGAPFNLDRSYLDEGKLSHAPFQAELMPLYMNRQYAYPPTSGRGVGMDRLHPQSMSDHNPYQDWDSAAGTPLMPGTPMVSIRPAMVPTSAAVAAASQSPRTPNMSSTLLASNAEIEGPKDEWASSTGAESLSSRNVSVSDLNEFERGRPQIRVKGEGEDSLFGDGVEVVPHNPHATSS